MRLVDRKEFWDYTRHLEYWHKNGIRYSQYEILEEGPGYQLQGQTWRDKVTGEILAQYVSRVENSAHVSSEYRIFDSHQVTG